MAKRMIVVLAAAAAVALGTGGCTVMGSTYAKKVSEADTLSRDLAGLQQKHKELSAENDALKARVAALSSDLGTASGERDRLRSYGRELEGMLKSRTDSLSQSILDLRGKVVALEVENGRLKTEIAALQKAQVQKVETVSKTYESLLEKMKKEIDQGQVTISELKGKLTVNMVDAILFDSGKAEVKPEGLEVLRKVVSILKDVKDKSIRIEGHTDNVQIVGMLARKFPTNRELSAARALTVARHLQDQGIDPAVLSAAAYGEYKPVAPNDAPEGRAKNRRIEIILVPRE